MEQIFAEWGAAKEAAYGDSAYWVPKDHWSRHLPKQAEDDTRARKWSAKRPQVTDRPRAVGTGTP